MSMYIYIYIYRKYREKIKDTWRQLNHPILFALCNPWSSWLQPSLPGSGISLSTSWSRQDITVKHVTSFSGNIWKQSRWTLTTYNSLDFFLGGAKLFNLCFFWNVPETKNSCTFKTEISFKHPNILFFSTLTSWWQPRCPGPGRTSSKGSKSISGGSAWQQTPELELDGFRVKIRSRSLVKNKVFHPYQL